MLNFTVAINVRCLVINHFKGIRTTDNVEDFFYVWIDKKSDKT